MSKKRINALSMYLNEFMFDFVSKRRQVCKWFGIQFMNYLTWLYLILIGNFEQVIVNFNIGIERISSFDEISRNNQNYLNLLERHLMNKLQTNQNIYFIIFDAKI